MKLKKISIVTVLLLLVGFAFTSCDEDKWESSSLIYDSYKSDPLLLDRNGVLRPARVNLSINDIRISERGGIRDIRVFDSFFLLSSPLFRNGQGMRIYLETSTRRRYEGEMVNNGYNSQARVGEFIIDLRDGNYAAFVDDLMYDLNRDGNLVLLIEGKSNIRQDMDVDFEFNNNLDLLIRR